MFYFFLCCFGLETWGLVGMFFLGPRWPACWMWRATWMMDICQIRVLAIPWRIVSSPRARPESPRASWLPGRIRQVFKARDSIWIAWILGPCWAVGVAHLGVSPGIPRFPQVHPGVHPSRSQVENKGLETGLNLAGWEIPRPCPGHLDTVGFIFSSEEMVRKQPTLWKKWKQKGDSANYTSLCL